ncbi:hypothetical protein PCANC_08414 [Puccinia coronata f. sp. avenae]|uniref:HMG box domain-containing protein n=1 Tax=Puccinia coronata f. sp. avenae TaxID=200324 RepID=A0A2N5VPQ6_9BASI|nr:hypothetical protein PCANC_08231 [Puccinia coronata f. sp. avenae]PLW51988.1 hypothetical protein PCANC_08414 [Puccinia coronata f. sp. avenae]
MASVFIRAPSRVTSNAFPFAPSTRFLLLDQPRFSSTKSVASDGVKPSTKQNTPVKAKKTRPAKLVPPKRAMNIMQLVTQDVISELKGKNGKLSKEDARQCFKMAGEKYRSLSDADKKNYLAELDRRREIYEIEMREFLDSLTPNDYVNQKEYISQRKAKGLSISRKGIPRLDPNAPKRPLNGFMIFCGEVRSNPSKFPDLAEQMQSAEKDNNSSVVEGSRLLANYWKSMPEDVKQQYLTEGQRRSDLYKQEKAEYDARSKPTPE